MFNNITPNPTFTKPSNKRDVRTSSGISLETRSINEETISPTPKFLKTSEKYLRVSPIQKIINVEGGEP